MPCASLSSSNSFDNRTTANSRIIPQINRYHDRHTFVTMCIVYEHTYTCGHIIHSLKDCSGLPERTITHYYECPSGVEHQVKPEESRCLPCIFQPIQRQVGLAKDESDDEKKGDRDKEPAGKRKEDESGPKVKEGKKRKKRKKRFY